MALELCQTQVSGMCQFFDNRESGVLPSVRGAGVLALAAAITTAVDASGINYYGGGGTTLPYQYVLKFEPSEAALASIFLAAKTEYLGANPNMGILIQNYQPEVLLDEMATAPGSAPSGVTTSYSVMVMLADITGDEYGIADGFSTGFYGQHSMQIYATESALVTAGYTKLSDIIPLARPSVKEVPTSLEPLQAAVDPEERQLEPPEPAFNPTNLLFSYVFDPVED